MSQTFVVTTSVEGNSSSRIWHASRPLPLGHPVNWLVEATAKGVRVRHLAGAMGEVASPESKEISFDAIDKGTEIKLPKFSLKIRRVAELPAPYAFKSGKTLKIYACAGNWILESASVESSYSARIHGRPIFALAKAGSQFQLKSEADGLQLGTQPVAFGETFSISADKLADASIHWGTYVWRFGMADAPSLSRARKKVDAENEIFKKSFGASVAAFLALLALSWAWPKSAPKEELIPQQFTKIVMTKPKASAAAESAPAKAETAQKVQKSAVVQAFRAKALQNSMSALLKGGMTNLLKQSDLVAGAGATASVGQMFNAKSEHLRSASPNAGLADNKNVKVAGVGGEASADGKTGYGKGNKAGVKGQGESFVSMDIAGADVQEGLTKDEVGEVIHRHLSEVRYCYETAMLRTPDIEGKLVVDFVIGGNGVVKSTEIKTSTLPDPRLDDCVVRRLVTWKFPNPKGGVDVAVSYPFIFKTLGR